MQTDPRLKPSSPTDVESSDHPAGLSGEALARRRLLIKGLGKGAAAVAVVAPIHTLAAPVIVGGTKLCTVSGVQSNVGSGRAGTNTDVCRGHSPSFFSTLSNWPGFSAGTATNTVDAITFTQATPFSTVFSGSATPLLTILTATPTSDEAAWIVALLNAIQNPPGFFFPYTPSQVRAFYNDPNPTNVLNALNFFKGYMQTVN